MINLKSVVSIIVVALILVVGGYSYRKYSQKSKQASTTISKELQEAQIKFQQAKLNDYNKFRDQEILACVQEIEKNHQGLTQAQMEAKMSLCRDQGNAWAGCLQQKGNGVDPTNIAECRKNMAYWKKTGYK